MSRLRDWSQEGAAEKAGEWAAEAVFGGATTAVGAVKGFADKAMQLLDPSTAPHDRRLQKLIQYSEELKAEDKKRKRRQKHIFTATGVAMAAAGVLMLFSLFAPGLLGWGATLGVIAMLVGGWTAFNAVGDASLQKLHDEVKRGRQKAASEISKRNTPPVLYKPKSPKILFGICAAIADKIG
ncbi:MAG: hypothetical protein RMM53_07380, partial [Bacteroidia bacterium]|nr:hypothetical protein [Bacteroidia bacterium]MDW8334020.1 hypothetical protein [Bacteroidia bacterium]